MNPSGDFRIFRNEDVFNPDYLPDKLLHREREIEEIAHALRPVSEGRKPANMIISGSSGTGKTSCTLHVLRELEEHSKKALPVYINCWETSTRYGILNRVATTLGAMIPRRGIAADEIMDSIVERAKAEDRVPIIVLDEADRLFGSVHGEETVLYDIARAAEVFSLNIGVVIITNREDVFAKMDQRIRSSLCQRRVIFERYNPSQLKDILRERASLAFFQGALDEGVIPTCAGIGAKRGGDARVALNALWQAGRRAEEENVKSVTVEHVKKVEMDAAISSSPLEKNVEKLNDIERAIVNALENAEGNELLSGELYKKLKGTTSDRNVRNYISELERIGIIETEEKGDVGKTRVVRLKRSP